MVKSNGRTKITGERIRTIHENPDLSDMDLSEKTGLPANLVEFVRLVDREGLRKDDLHGR